MMEWFNLLPKFSTKTVQARPTSFFEIIQRKGQLLSGKEFKALFLKAIEREQEFKRNFISSKQILENLKNRLL